NYGSSAKICCFAFDHPQIKGFIKVDHKVTYSGFSKLFIQVTQRLLVYRIASFEFSKLMLQISDQTGVERFTDTHMASRVFEQTTLREGNRLFHHLIRCFTQQLLE